MLAYSLTRSVEDGDDLVQSTCERAIRARDTWQPGTRLDSWMFRIMRNHWIDRLRRRRLENSVVSLQGDEILAGEDGRQTLAARDELAVVRDAILQLPEEQRTVLILVCVEALSYREAAEVLEVPIGTVMSRLARARQKITEVAEIERSLASTRRTGSNA
jgi:RNA polymerase sigma-70 factor (ECF subfamily)